jgi:hypothetical protein
MATKDELINGLQVLIQESTRIANDLSDADWARAVDFDGWKSKEVLAHVAGVGTLVSPLINGAANAPAGTNAGAGIDINAINAGMVAARADKSVAEIADELAKNYGAVIDFVKSASDDLLAKPVTFAGYVDVPVSDIIVRMVILHGLAHVYSAYSAVFEQR